MKKNRNLCIQMVAIVAAAVLSACSGGGGGSTPVTTAQGMNSVAYAVSNSAPASVCPTGGITVDAGIDTNGNGVLDASEITGTQYVCNGAAGADGLTTLVLISSEPSGTNCASGGSRVDAGKDANGNNVLDASEISSTQYVCNGAAGSNGTNGTNGSNGLNTLVAITSEPSGSNCTYGGQKVQSGLDSNANQVLDAGEVTTTTYVCDGAPGPGVTWQDVTGTSVQAVSNTGYLADNTVSQVTITLPVSPVFGDIVQVSGVGAGGWKVAQNAGQSIITRNLPGGVGAVWTPHESVRYWASVASSADGTKLVAAESGGQIYTSTDSGVTWTPRDSVRNWIALASSADGVKLVAAEDGGQLYTSTDSGVTWTPRDSARNWTSLASSADGSKLAATESGSGGGGQIYMSIDSGATWTGHPNGLAVGAWVSIASSADGSTLVAADRGAGSGGMVWTSIDFGGSWFGANTSMGEWFAVASSADGSRLVAADLPSSGIVMSQIYTSTDGAWTWTPRQVARHVTSIGSSDDGSVLVAADYGGLIYTSNDFGATWTSHDTYRGWRSAASSADGSRLVAVAYNGQIYTSTDATSVGIAGSISGGQYESVELQYIGNNTFTVLSHEGSLVVQ